MSRLFIKLLWSKRILSKLRYELLRRRDYRGSVRSYSVFPATLVPRFSVERKMIAEIASMMPPYSGRMVHVYKLETYQHEDHGVSAWDQYCVC